MKRRPEPLRADHNLLAPDTRFPPGVRHCAISEVNSYHNNSPRTQTAGRSSRRRPESSPSRRLRFEDETEKEAESRYLERQKRRAGQRAQDILVSKPDVSQYVNGRHRVTGESQYSGRLGVNLQLHPTPPVYNQSHSLYPIPPARPVISLRTEPIKETYIGVVTYSDSDGGETEEQVGQRRATNTGGRRRTNHIKQNGLRKRSDLPVNPYEPEKTAIPTHAGVSAPSTAKSYSSPLFSPAPPASLAATSHNGKHSGARTDRRHKKSKAKDQKCQNADPTEDHGERGSEEETLPSRLQTQGGLIVGESSPDIKTTTSSAGGHQIQTASNSNGNKRSNGSKQPTRAEPPSPLEPVEGSRLSLRRLFSSVRLGRSRSSSLDRTSSRPCSPDLTSGQTKTYGLLKKTPSVQSLTMGSPFMKLRKAASVQNFVLEQKKKDRSENYKPGAQSVLQRCLSVEDVSCPSSLRSVGRILQVYTDGTLLLELSRPKSQTYGFLISRGKGRTDSGVYVEDMVDSSTEKLYAGLLAVGDEILEVNEEKVACLSLDQVTHLLSHSSSVKVRVLRQRKLPSR
ncbi:uncharacterized protein [Eucyclogobius newberryi]|uniref:uncharacterized protein n=1 Tax=Eucyclogobius newberryi TaxID=166745 RepID=UPI003B5B62C0